MPSTTISLKTNDGGSREYMVDEKGRPYIDVVADYFSDYEDRLLFTPEDYEIDEVEHHEKDDTYSWHENPERWYFRPLPPPVECDTAPLTHRIRWPKA